MPVLTGKGYFVLRPNYRGSVGYGDAFLRDVVNGYFKNMRRTCWRRRRADRAGDRGSGSTGDDGMERRRHLTNKLITFTTGSRRRPRAPGVANWMSLFAESDITSIRADWFGGTPWRPNAPRLFWNNSPIKDAAKVRTPTLFIAGEDDARVPLPQAIEMFRALKAERPDALLIGPREAHQWTELRHLIARRTSNSTGSRPTCTAAPTPGSARRQFLLCLNLTAT